MKKKRLNLRGSLSSEFVDALPPSIACIGCRTELVAVTKDFANRRVKIKMHVTKPPVILDLERHAGAIRCEKCGVETPIDLRLFLLDGPTTH